MQSVVWAGLTSLVLGLAACDHAKPPDEVAKDVANARQQAAVAVDRSEDRAAADLDKAAATVDDKLITFNDDAARDVYDVTVTKAFGDRKIALARCLSLEGDAQKVCRDHAEADYNTAKANAEAVAKTRRQ